METPPSRPGHGLRTGLLLATGLVVVALAIGVVAIVLVLHRVGSAVGTASRDLGPENPGAPDSLTVTEGTAFTFHDQRFDAGWRLRSSRGAVAPTGLRFTGEDDSSHAATGYLDLRLYHEGRLVGVSRCHSDDALEPGSPNEMVCTRVVPQATPVDRIDVADFRLSY